jgi:flagellar hook-basal body complex protein FliE
MAIPAAAAAAYRAAAQIATTQAAPSAVAPANLPGSNFGDFLSGAIKDATSTIRQGEHSASQQVQGKANLVDVVQSVNAAEITLDTVVAVRDKVVAAYQSIMNMPI